MISADCRMGRRAALFATFCALAFVAGCSLTRPSPARQSYLLDPVFPPPAAKAQPGWLRMGVVNVAAPFRNRSFVVRDAELQYDSDFYHEFFVPPGVMIGDATAQALTRSKVFAEVSRPGVPADSNWALDGFVGAIYADGRDAAKPVAVLEITYYLSRDDGGASAPVWSHAYAKRVPFVAGGTNEYVAALNTAFSEILAELTRDLAAAELPPR
jgi:cholesterol transport system auxiliary component